MSDVDIWLLGFKGRRREPLVDRLQRVFGIDAGTAMEIEQSIPCAVKFGLPHTQATKWVDALEEIGGIVELRPSGPAPAGRISLPAPGLGADDSISDLVSGGLEISGPLELADVAPARRPERAKPSTRSASGGASVRPGGDARGIDRAVETSGWFGRLRDSLLMLAGGAIFLGIGYFGLHKSFLMGNATFFTLALDGAGLALATLGTLYLLAVLLFNASAGSSSFSLTVALVLGYAGAFGLNYAKGQGMWPFQGVRLNASEVDGTPEGSEARGWLEEEGSRFDIGTTEQAHRFVQTMYTAGSPRVLVTSEVYDTDGRRALEIAVEMPASGGQRAAITRAYRAFLGSEAGSFAPDALRPPATRWWIMDVAR